MQVKAYKGFNKDMTCRGFQYEEGMEYTFEGDIKLCERGFHACEAPVDVFFFYAPATSVFHEVEVDEVSNEREGDSKIVARKIRIGKRLSVQDLCRAQIEYISMHTTSKATDEKSATAVDCGSATAGYRGAATAGDCGSATSMGESSVGGNGVAVARSSKAKAKGGLGAILVLAIEEHLSHKLIDWKAVVVDGKTVLPDTWYTLRDGELVIADA